MISSDQIIIKEFIRGDLSSSEFEKWLYKSSNFENDAGHEFYLEVISTDFNDKHKSNVIKGKLESFLRQKFPSSCECLFLSNMAITDEGSERWRRVFKTMNEVKRYGQSRWWLSLNQCNNCSQYWLVAQESRINDIDLFMRLEEPIANNIIQKDEWPEYFKTFGELLAIGKSNNRSARFDDPFSFSLVIAVQDLKENKPYHSIAEIASLLNLEEGHVRELCKWRWRIFWKLKFWSLRLKFWA